MALNIAAITGRLTADPEVRNTSSNVSVCRFTVAVDRSYVRQGEERQADFIDVVAWRQTAEFVGKYFQKGSMIAVQGSIQTGSYEKDGIKRRTFEIVADNVSFCGGKNEQSNGTGTVTSTPTPSFANADPNDFAAFAASLDDDELPF